MVRHGGFCLVGVAAGQCVQDGLVLGDGVLGVGDAHSPEKAEALDLSPECSVGADEELVVRLLRNQLVEAFVGLEVVLVFGKGRAARRRLQVCDSLFKLGEPVGFRRAQASRALTGSMASRASMRSAKSSRVNTGATR